MKIESGVMVMKNGLAWGKCYSDGHSTAFGWVNPENAELHNPKYLTRPEHLTYSGSIYEDELRTGKIVHVERVTTVRQKE